VLLLAALLVAHGGEQLVVKTLDGHGACEHGELPTGRWAGRCCDCPDRAWRCPITATMQALPFAEASLDLIWSEGAIYNMGFEAGLAAWRRLLRPAGVVAVSEITWLTEVRPAELEDYWLREYPAIATASDKVTQLETLGFELLGYFALPPSCWLEGYYRPLEQRFAAFLEAQAHSAAAQDIVAAERREIALYERYADHYSYGFYIARRSD
jgi:SAM-dependent methyltransferase